MTHRFTAKAESALRASLSIAASLGHTYLGSEHLLFGLASEREGVAARILEGGGANSDKIRETISLFTGIGRKSTVGAEDMTPRVRKIIEAAGARAGGGTVGTEHLLWALLKSDGCVARKVLSSIGTDTHALLDDLSVLLDGHKDIGNKRKDKKAQGELPFASFGRDLTEMAREGRLDPVIGRETEIGRLIRVLSRRNKNNPCLVGDPGVGKTAVIEGLALRITKGAVPEPLLDKRIFSLDLSSVVAGAKYRGEFEERMRTLLDALRKAPDVFLFIDEIHTIVGAGAAEGAIDAANILKPAMARGEIRVIGATTPEEYRRHIEKDSALERRFQPIRVEAPDKDATRAILMGLRERYESHHGLTISDEAIEAAIDLSVRYLPEHHLPDKALDLLDEAASELRLRRSYLAMKRKNSEDIIRQKEIEKENAILAQDFERAGMLRDEIAALSAEATEGEAEEQDMRPTVTAELIAETVSDRTGIPAGQLGKAESERLSALEGELARRVIGQGEAVSALAAAVRRARTGTRDPRRPVGSFLFLGPTGVGKTELCRALAEAYFGSESALLRFDMSEYAEGHSVSRLLGSPPGYVGFDEGGQLSERVRRRPYSVVLFDEIEKAHPELYNLLLQILEDGFITDAHGRRADFRHAIIIMTSNIGSAAFGKERPLGFANIDHKGLSQREAALRELKVHFRPELINRIDEVVTFGRLRQEDLERIAHKMLSEVLLRIHEAGFPLTLGEGIAAHLSAIGYSEEYGARELRRAVLHHFEDRFALAVVEGRLTQGEEAVAELKDGRIEFYPASERATLPTG